MNTLPDDINNRELNKFDRHNRVKTTNYSPNGVESDITSDSWGRAKIVNDYSIFHALFTYEVPDRIWLLKEDGSEVLAQNSNRVSSVSGTLEIKSGANNGEYACLRSRRHPRYQPNRGHLYSTTIILNKPNNGKRGWGLLNCDNQCNAIDGTFFMQEGGKLYAVIYNESSEFKKEEIDISVIPNFDITKGNLYDIQFQWRGVGDYFFYINQTLVHTIKNIGTLELVSISNPALPGAFFSKNIDGEEVYVRSGCIDISSEGGTKEGLYYTGVAMQDDYSVTTKTPPVGLLAVHSKNIHKSKDNTRDTQLLRLQISADQSARFTIFITRDPTAFTDLSLSNRYDDSVLQFMDNSDPANTNKFTFDVTKGNIITRGAVSLGNPFILGNPSEDVEFIINPGDYVVIVGAKKSTNVNMSATLEFGEEI